LSSDGKSVTLTIVDGGLGDLDGTANGIIIDPSGLGASETSTDGGDDSSGDSDSPLGDAIDSLSSQAGCFIATAAQRPADSQLISFRTDGRSIQWAILSLLLLPLIVCRKKKGLK
jgi:hypothetical protein